MRLLRLFSVALLAALPIPALPGQPASSRNTRIAAADLRADLAVLRDAYQTLHPGLLRYNTQQQVDSAFDATDRSFASGQTLASAFLALTRLTAWLKCGHSYPNFWNQPKHIADALFEGRDKLPLEFRWVGGRMIVTRDLRDTPTLTPGTEILRLNGTPASQLLAQLLPLARADGGNDAKRIAYLEVRQRSRYHAFDILYGLMFPVPGGTFTLQLRSPEGRLRTVTVAALDANERRARGSGAQGSVAPGADTLPLWEYVERDGLGVMRMPTWALFNSKWNATRWADSLIDAAIDHGVTNLVLDLRGNEGGLDAGNSILERLIVRPIALPFYHRFVRAGSVPERLRAVLDTWDRTFFDLGTQAQASPDPRFRRLTRWDGSDTGAVLVRPRGRRFAGKVWVIVGAENSSATFQFALAVKQSGVATLVGQPTGGNRRGINGGAFFFVRLPRTGLEVDLPLIAGFPTTDEPDAGVEPDVLVQPNTGDIAARRDAELEAIRQRIRSGSR